MVPGICWHLELFDLEAQELGLELTCLTARQTLFILSHPLPRVLKNVFQLVLICLPAVQGPILPDSAFCRHVFRKDTC